MSGPWRLKRTRQCEKCPWRVETDPFDIPNGYDPQKHADLISTIAEPGSLVRTGRAMACHETHEAHCVGWLVNQLGPGNNIGLRIQMMTCENATKIRLRGEQHERFEDTLPEDVNAAKNDTRQRCVSVREGARPTGDTPGRRPPVRGRGAARFT